MSLWIFYFISVHFYPLSLIFITLIIPDPNPHHSFVHDHIGISNYLSILQQNVGTPCTSPCMLYGLQVHSVICILSIPFDNVRYKRWTWAYAIFSLVIQLRIENPYRILQAGCMLSSKCSMVIRRLYMYFLSCKSLKAMLIFPLFMCLFIKGHDDVPKDGAWLLFFL